MGQQGNARPSLECHGLQLNPATNPYPPHLCLQVLIAESYGGADEPVDTLLNNFVGAGVEPVLDPLRVKSDPNEATYQVNGLGRQKLLADPVAQPLLHPAISRQHTKRQQALELVQERAAVEDCSALAAHMQHSHQTNGRDLLHQSCMGCIRPAAPAFLQDVEA